MARAWRRSLRSALTDGIRGRTGLTQWPPGRYLSRLVEAPVADRVPGLPGTGGNSQITAVGAENVDLVLVIDATASMTPLIGQVQTHALEMESQLRAALARSGTSLGRLRVRTVVFGDILDGGPGSLRGSPFLDLPVSAKRFRSDVRGIRLMPGESWDESGLEGLALAVRSDWAPGVDRAVIVLWTDAAAHPLEARGRFRGPVEAHRLPRTFEQLTAEWHDRAEAMGGDRRKLVLYAPDVPPWSIIAGTWGQVVHRSIRAGGGLAEVDFSSVVTTIVGGIASLG